MATDFQYVGEELDMFAAATNWKGYFRGRIDPYLGDEVLEVGAGFGGTTRTLCRRDHDRWVCLEPDAGLAARLADSVRDGSLPRCCEPVVGTLETLPAGERFDTLLYIDVMEHIDDDLAEMTRAAGRLKPGGHVVVLSPAHPFLFTPFDAALGHFRRYTRSTLARLTVAPLEPVENLYLDSVGMLASLGNRLVLNASMPKPSQIAAWDKLMVPLSRVVDPLTGHRLGKSILGVWRSGRSLGRRKPPRAAELPVGRPSRTSKDRVEGERRAGARSDMPGVPSGVSPRVRERGNGCHN